MRSWRNSLSAKVEHRGGELVSLQRPVGIDRQSDRGGAVPDPLRHLGDVQAALDQQRHDGVPDAMQLQLRKLVLTPLPTAAGKRIRAGDGSRR